MYLQAIVRNRPVFGLAMLITLLCPYNGCGSGFEEEVEQYDQKHKVWFCFCQIRSHPLFLILLSRMGTRSC
jgi:hypothetical protein